MRWNRGLVLTSLFKHSHRNEESVLHALGKPPVWVTSERRSGLMNVVDSTWSGRVTSPRSPLTSIYVSQPKVASRTWNIAYAVIQQTSTSKPKSGHKERARLEFESSASPFLSVSSLAIISHGPPPTMPCSGDRGRRDIVHFQPERDGATETKWGLQGDSQI